MKLVWAMQHAIPLLGALTYAEINTSLSKTNRLNGNDTSLEHLWINPFVHYIVR